MIKNVTSKRASAILVSLLVMAVLIVIGIAINELVVYEIRVQADEVQRLKAYYAAESGIEKGLLDIYEHNIPGYTRPEILLVGGLKSDENANYVQREMTDGFADNDLRNYRYQVFGQDDTVPCDFLVDEKIEGPYGTLEINESATIPLHKYIGTDDSGDKKEEIEDFAVEYYVTPEGLARLLTENEKTRQDVLRWKVFALTANARRFLYGEETDAISDYVPLKNGFNTKDMPTRFASNPKIGEINTDPKWASAKYYKREVGINEYRILDTYPVNQFVKEHSYNFLMITNVLGNLVMLQGGKFVPDTSNPGFEDLLNVRKIHYRVITSPDKKLACNSYMVKADGFIHGAKQSLDVRIALDTFLPVFDFALYEINQ